MDRDEIDLNKLTDFQKRKLIKFYNVNSIDDLEVFDDGTIVVKNKGSGKPIAVYIEDYDGKQNRLDIDEFIEKEPRLGFQDVSKEKAREELEGFIREIIDMQKKKDDLKQLCLEHIGKSTFKMLLFQQFIIFYADKLRTVLCDSQINKKYIKAVGNPGYSDVDFYNLFKKSDDELVIKGFAFCGYPSKKELFINLVCGTGGTGKLIHTIHGMVEAKTLANKPAYVSLDSIETEQALEFYAKLGFRKPKKETMETINSMLKSKAKTFQDYADTNPSKTAGKLYLFPHNAEGEKYLKKLNCHWIYTPVKWFDAIQTMRKEKKPTKYIKDHLIETMKTSKLEGDGIGDFFKSIYNKGKEAVKTIVNRFQPKLDDFTNQSKATLAKYGDWRVINMYIQRKPIMGILDKFFNVLTFGKFQELKQKYGYDKLFHLQLRMLLMKNGQYKKVVAEKNETVDITEASGLEGGKGVETLRLPVPGGKVFTLNDIINQTRQRVGDNTFFSYDPFTNNCQFFLRYLLETEGMYGDQQKSFLFQDMTEFVKELPKWLPGFARGVTDLGATVSNVIGKGKDDGYELHAVILKKEGHSLEDAKKKAKEIIKGNKKYFRETKDSYRFRNIPKQKFEKKSFITKVLDDGTSLVFGKLKST